MNPGLLGLGTAFAWGTADFMARYSGREVGPARVALVVSGGSIALLAPFAFWHGVGGLLDPTVTIFYVLAGVFTALAMGLLFTVLARGPLSVVAPTLASYPVPLVIYALLGWGFTPSPGMWIAIATTLVGVWVVARAGHSTSHKDGHAMGSIGVTIALSLGAVLSFDASIILIREASTQAGELPVIWASRVVATACIALSFAARRESVGVARKWWGFLGAQAVLDTTGIVFLFWGQSGEGTTIATVTSSAYGVITVVLARAYLKEVISGLQLLGMVLVFGGAAALSVLS